MRLIMLLFSLPWWVDLILLASVPILWFGLRIYFSRKFDQIVNEAVLGAGAVLRDAKVEIHSVTAVPPPSAPSPYDLQEDDENYVEGLDDEGWNEEGTEFYLLDVTITPATPEATWDPTVLCLVPAEFAPEDATECCTTLCPLHSAEVMANGQFRPARETAVRGPQRLRMLYAVHS